MPGAILILVKMTPIGRFLQTLFIAVAAIAISVSPMFAAAMVLCSGPDGHVAVELPHAGHEHACESRQDEHAVCDPHETCDDEQVAFSVTFEPQRSRDAAAMPCYPSVAAAPVAQLGGEAHFRTPGALPPVALTVRSVVLRL